VIVAVGEINNLDIEGPRDRASQKIEVEAKVYREVPAASEAGRAAEVGSSSHATKIAAVAAVVAAAKARKSGGTSGSSRGGGGSSGYNPGRGYTPSPRITPRR
jgi:hypothetical protein